MHRFATVLLAIFLTASGALALPLNPTITHLGNSLTVIIQEDHTAELVGIDVYVKAGSRYETPKNNGVSHMIEHLLFGSTQKRHAGDMDREMESVGATLDAHTTYDYAHYSTTVSSRYLAKALDIFADAVSNSAFADEDIARERPVILDEIARKETKPTSVCRDLLSRMLYGDHPYALPIEGTRETVRGITREQLLDYYHKRYVPSNIAIVLVGDLDKQSALSEVKKLFQESSPVSVSSEPIQAAVPKLTKQSISTAKAPFEADYLAIGFAGPAGADYEDVCATDVLLTYLGHGYRNWILDELKAKQAIVIDGSADFVTERDPGLISIIVSGASVNLPKARDAIFAKIAAIQAAGLSQADVDRAKRSLLGQSAFSTETVGGRANLYGFYFAVSDPAFAVKYTDCVQSVTSDAVKSVARKYLDPSAGVVITVGPDQEASK